MLKASAALDWAHLGDPVSPRLFGAFVEHSSRSIYTGIFEPGHPRATAEGFRADVLDLVRELGVRHVRYPGGNFVSGYRWEDGVGPRDRRPARLNPAWRQTEPNAFGLDEFISWTRAAGVEPMLSLNLGTRGIVEALDLLEYANHPGGTALSDRRVANGAEQPYGVRQWCLGNEPDGPWQLGHMTAYEYGRLAAETARAMRQFEPGLTLVAAGSSGVSMPTFGSWEEAVLTETYPLVDAISLHFYVEEIDADLAGFLASPTAFEAAIGSVVAIADAVAARLGERRRMAISVDEWNVWRLSQAQAQRTAGGREDWPVVARLAEERYTVADAVVVGGMLISLLRHADRVRSACISQLVNRHAPIATEPDGPAWRQTTFHPFALTARHARGRVLPVLLDVTALDCVATVDDEASEVALFLVNRSTSEPAALRLDLGSSRGTTVVEALVLTDPDPHATNSVEQPDRVVPRPLDAVAGEPGLRLVLPPISWALVRLDVDRTGSGG